MNQLFRKQALGAAAVIAALLVGVRFWLGHVETSDAQDSGAGKNQPTPAVREELIVRGYRVENEDLEQVAQRLRTQLAAEPGVRIAADPRTKQLVVVASQRVHERLAAQFPNDPKPAPSTKLKPNPVQNTQVGNAAPVPAAVPNVHQLKHVTAQEFENGLKQIWGAQVHFAEDATQQIVTARLPTTKVEPAIAQIDRRRAQVSFTGHQDARRGWNQLVQSLDVPRMAADSAAQLLPFQRSDPEQLKRTLRVVQASFGGQAEAQPNDAQPKPAVAPGDAPPNGKRPVLVADGSDDNGDDDSGLIGNVQIEFLEGLDVIVVRGKKRDVERVTKIINDIERLSTETRPNIELLPLVHVNSQAVSEVVVQVYDQILSLRQGRVSITALGKPNAILLIGRQESIAVVIELVKKLDHPVAPETLWQVFPLKHASVVEAEQTVNRVFGITTGTGLGGGVSGVASPTPAGPTGGGAAGGGGSGATGGSSVGSTANLKPRLTIVADFRSNALVVQGSPRDLEDVAALLAKIDIESTESTTELRIFKLQNTLAQEMAPLLQSAIRGQQSRTTGAVGGGQTGVPAGPQGGGGLGAGTGVNAGQDQVRSTNLQIVTVDAQGNKIVSSGILSDIVVNADATANALVVRAPAKSMDLIEALIKQLDSLPDAQSQIKVFTVLNGDATNMAAMLQQLFGQQVTIGRGTGGLFGAGNTAALNLAPQGGVNAGESSLVPLRFAVDMRSNSIIASGSSGDLSVVETLLLRLDEGDVPARKMSVYRLKNAFAQDVATSITQIITAQQQSVQQNLLFNQAIGPFEQLQQQFSVVAEPQTNSVVVSATPKFYEEVMAIIKKLDYRPPMVMVQVLIAEVSLSDFYEFGVEMGLQDSLLFDRGRASLAAANTVGAPGYNFNSNGLPNLNSFARNSVAPQGVSTFGLGRTNPTLGYGGLVLSAASDSISTLVRALQDSGKLQVLSRPQVMAIHNRQAQVLVGRKVPRLRGTTVNANTQTQNIEDVDTGLILNIIPQINDDGIVVLNVQAEKSQLGDVALTLTSTGVGGAVTSTALQSIDTTSAVTTISARNDQTVVFAGLITTEKQLLVRRVPYLSDIPVLGRLFQYKQDKNTRKELLIVMTPHIIEYDEDYEWIKAVESDRMNWCLGDVVNVHGEVGLRGNNCLFCPEHIPVIYPDQDPTGSHLPQGYEGEEVLESKQELGQRGKPGVRTSKRPVGTPAQIFPVPMTPSPIPANRNAQAVQKYPQPVVSEIPRSMARPPHEPEPLPTRGIRPAVVTPAAEPLTRSTPQADRRFLIAPAGFAEQKEEQPNRLPPVP